MEDSSVESVHYDVIERIADAGLDVEFIESPAVAEQYLLSSSKSGVSPYMQSSFGDLGAHNSLWILLLSDGVVVGSVGTRCDFIEVGAMAEFWEKQQRRLQKACLDVKSLPPVTSEMHGSVVYLGDLFLEPRSRVDMRLLGMLAYTSVFNKWKPDWYYAFMTSRDASRRQLFNFNMPRVYEDAWQWIGEIPKGRTNSDWMVAMTSADFHFTIDRYLRRTCQSREVQDQLPAIRAVNG